MAACLIFVAGSFKIEEQIEESKARVACVMTGLYLFMAVYSPGEGPVPFTYSAEAFPLHIRDIGMSSATAITWGFNFIISFSWPMIEEAFSPTGGFLFYAGWNLFGWVFAYFLLPETKGLTLEELDSVFSMTNREHSGYYTKKLPWYLSKYLLRSDVGHYPPLYEFAEEKLVENRKSEKPVTHHDEATAMRGQQRTGVLGD